MRRVETLALGLLAVLALLGSFAPSARAQLPAGIYLEPMPRAAGVRVPLDVIAALDAGVAALGIPGARRFFTDTQLGVVAREGDFPLLVIPALFADSDEPPVSHVELQRLLFDGPTEGGTLPEFYHAASRGRLRVLGRVSPWVRTSVMMRDAAGERDGHGWVAPPIYRYVEEAIRLAEEHIDFADFDSNDDGFVNGVAIKYMEVSGACGGPAPWPHFGPARGAGGLPVVTSARTPAGVPIRVQVYIAASAMDCTGQQPDGVEVLAHEFGHLLGLPDLYRQVDGLGRENRAWAVGCFDLMAGGAWAAAPAPGSWASGRRTSHRS